jgi:hypothetical protein
MSVLEQICPHCDEANPLDNHFCGRCGDPLSERSLATRPNTQMVIGRRSLLPAQSWRHLGRAVALSLAALAAEAGLSWLRSQVSERSALPRRREKRQPATTDSVITPTERSGRIIRAGFGRRIIQIRRAGQPTQQWREEWTWQVEE